MSRLWIVSRHPGAVVWLARQGYWGTHLDHLEIDAVASGDTVIGTLPINLVSDVCRKGAVYIHLSLRLPACLRGVELTPEQMEACGVQLQRYQVLAIDHHEERA